MPESIGDARKKHPLPLRLRNQHVPKEEGGSFGYRGKGFAKARELTLRRYKNRSSNTGSTPPQVKLEVDHIIPYRVGGITPNTNRQINLRVTDMSNNKYSDMAESFKEKPRKKSLPKF